MFDAWCATVPGIVRQSDGLWASPTNNPVSFPDDAHPLLARVEESSFWFKHRNAVIAAIVRRFPPPGLLFDIGGGNGYVGAGLKAAGFSCAIIEPGEAGVRTARERGLPVLRAAFQDLKVPDNSMPAAGLFDVLEHIQGDEAALAALYRALSPGGRLYVAVPSHRFLWSGEDVRAGHYRRYNARGLNRKLVGAGFSVMHQTYFFGILMLPILFLRALPWRLGLERRVDVAADHALPQQWPGRWLAEILDRERRAIDDGRQCLLGASLLMVAEKPGTSPTETRR